MRLSLKPDDRLHLLVWRSMISREWVVSRAVNGSPIDYGYHFDTWGEAMEAVEQLVAGND